MLLRYVSGRCVVTDTECASVLACCLEFQSVKWELGFWRGATTRRATMRRSRTLWKRNWNESICPAFSATTIFVSHVADERMPSNCQNLRGDISVHLAVFRLFTQFQKPYILLHPVLCNSFFSRTSCCT